MTSPPGRPFWTLGRGSWPETRRIAEIVRKETVGGALLLAATVVALAWANSPWSESYAAVRDAVIGPAALHLDLTVGAWAADGLLAVFFFVAGLELKREFVAGDLRDPRRAALPVVAAVVGMLVPGAIYVAVTWNAGGDALRGWAIPTATDIAFALAVLAVVGTHLPAALRTFLLTLAVVDDLLAITVIAFFYTDELHLPALAAALAPLGLFTLAVQRGVGRWWVLVPLAVCTWLLVHESGVHATIAGVLLGFAVPVRSPGGPGEEDGPGPAERLEHRLRPISAGLAVPVFALFSAGVTVHGLSGLTDALRDPVAIGVVLSLVVGKTVGITAATYLVCRFTHARLDPDLAWVDVVGLSVLAGIGFTVSLLIGELAFGPVSTTTDHVKVAVLAGSLLAAVLATVVLRSRNRTYRRMYERESVDANADGIPDVFEDPD
jgi:Na+:H+ antiporter, NhaA family